MSTWLDDMEKHDRSMAVESNTETGISGIVSLARKKRGLTQEELAELTHLTVRTIQRIENGKTTPRSYTLRTISTALDIPFEDLHAFHNSDLSYDPLNTVTAIDAEKVMHELRLICLSCFSYLVLPFVHFLVPLYLQRKMKGLPPAALAYARHVLRGQIYWLLALHLMLLLTVAYNFLVVPHLHPSYFLHYLVPTLFMYVVNALWITRTLLECKKLTNNLQQNPIS